MRNSLSGKVALITGASTGIGLASAHELAAEGVRLFITGRRGPEIADAARAIGRGTVGVQADVSNLADLDRLYDQISRDAGRLDVVFANAGGGDMLPLEAITAEHVDRIFGTNVKGLLFTVQKALPLMKEGGSVILTGSTAGRKGTASFSVYSASKAAVRSLARSWVLELASRRIRVNVVSPGPIATPGLAALVPADHKGALFQQLASVVPMGRLGDAAEVAKAVAFLASEDASFINGAELFVDGGVSASMTGRTTTMNAKELLQTYLSSIQNAEAAAALFADDGVIELPTVNARAQGPVAIQRFLTGLLAKVPDFQFENVRIWIETPDRVFGEYDAQGHVVATGKPYKQTYAGLLVAEHGKIKLLHEALDTLAASRAFSADGV